MRLWTVACVFGLVTLLGMAPITLARSAEPVQYDLQIDPQPLSSALQEFAKQSGIQVIFFSRVTEGLEAPSLSGRYTAAGAITRLLENSTLTFREVNARTIEVQPRAAVLDLPLRGAPTAPTLTPIAWPALQASSMLAEGSAQERGSTTSASRAAEQSTRSSTISLEEIVVTARKREESVLQAPLAVTALSAADIEEADIYDLADVATLTSGLTYRPSGVSIAGGRNTANIAFRGMNATYGTAREQSGSLFVDGIYVSSVGISAINTIDVERVEVLKGPQNAYFGRSTFGGAVNFVTRNPGDEFAGQLDAGATTRDGHDLNLSLEGPLVEGKLAGRLSLLSHQKGAHYTAQDGGPLGEERTQSVVGTLYATPTDRFWVRLRAHYQEDEDSAYSAVFIRALQYGSLCPGQSFSGATATGEPTSFVLSQPYFCGSPPELDDLGEDIVSVNTTLTPSVLTQIGQPNLYREILVNNSLNNPLLAKTPDLEHSGMRRDVLRASAQAGYEFANGITVEANFGYNEAESTVANDIDRTNQQNIFAVVPQINTDYSAELRVQSAQEQRVRWLAGLNYFDLRYQSQAIGYQINVVRGAPLPTVPFVNPSTDDRATVPAVFGAVDFDITDALALSGELRYQEDRSSVASTGGRTSFEFESWLPRVILQYSPSGRHNLYGSWSRGVMPGQLNGGYARATPAQRAEIEAQFPGSGELAPLPEVDSYEIGFKQRLFDGRLQYSASAYYMKWEKINTSVSVFVTGPNNSLIPLSVIAPNDAELRGIELDARALLTPKWELGLNLNLQDNEYETFRNPPLATLTSGVTRFDGNTPPQTPKATANLSSTYRDRLNDTWQWFARGDVAYTGKSWDSEANLFEFDAFTRVDARVGIDSEALRLEAYVTNLFDDASWNYGYRFSSLGEPGALLLVPFNGALTTVQGFTAQPPDKREFGLRMSYRFR